MTPAQEREFRMLKERVETLTGQRGAADNKALTIKDLSAINNAIVGTKSAATGGVNGLATGLNGLSQGVADAQKRLSATETDLKSGVARIEMTEKKVSAAGSVTIANFTAVEAAGAAPTKAEFDKAISDLRALRASVEAFISAFK